MQAVRCNACEARRGPGEAGKVRVADGEPGGELQVAFGRMTLVVGLVTGRNRARQALIFTACDRVTAAW